MIDERGLDGHDVCCYVPSFLERFATAKINALIFPRPHLGLAGNYDRLTPAKGLDRIDQELQSIYEAHQVAGAWQFKRYEIDHYETAQRWSEIMFFLNQWLAA